MTKNPFSTNLANIGAQNAFETSVKGDSVGKEVISIRKNGDLNGFRNVYAQADYPAYVQYRRNLEMAREQAASMYQPSAQQETIVEKPMAQPQTPDNVVSLQASRPDFQPAGSSQGAVEASPEGDVAQRLADARRNIEESYGQAA